MGINACVVGATGLVGHHVVELLCADVEIATIHLMARRATDIVHPKIMTHRLDFDQIKQSQWPTCDVLFCCLGTTIKIAGSEAAFRKVDFDYVIAAGRRARIAGASSLVVVSAMGAKQRSKVFYNRTKGDMEAAVASLGFKRVIIVRPSLLAGPRTQRRPAERLALAIMKVGNLFLPKKYQSISALTVARAMIMKAKDDVSGVRVIESDQLQRIA